MKVSNLKTTTLALIFAGISISGFALDLSKYQSYLKQNKKNASQQTQKLPEPVKSQEAKILPDIAINADAGYGNNSGFMPLNKTQKRLDGEHFLLPGDTKVPKELAPILTETRTPSQGLALNGGTGGILIPSPGVLKPDKKAVGVHVQTFELYDATGNQFEDQDYFDVTISGAWGMENGIEVGFDKTFANQDRYDIDEPLYLNFKYQTGKKVTVGGSINCNSGYHSVWAATGLPVIWVGVGSNFGASDYKFTYSTLPGKRDKFKKAKYGGYNYNYDTATGHADKFFFMVGGLIPLNKNLRFAYDFNGDKFSLGFRFNYLDSLYLEASYLSNGDYENLPHAISHKKSRNFTIGGTIAF